MRRQAGPRARALFVFGAALVLSVAGVAVAAAPARAATICVGSGAGCVGSLQAALAPAADGDTIRPHAGTFMGGVTVIKSGRIVGAGSARTTIRGGGPGLAIGGECAHARRHSAG